MPTIPWSSSTEDRSAPTVVQVSRLELARWRDVPGFLRTALRLRRATLDAAGAVGVSLRAAPLRRTFWTLSSWEDEDSIGAFVRSDTHRAAMVRYRKRMAGSHFHTWVEGDQVSDPPRWADALRRLDDAVPPAS